MWLIMMTGGRPFGLDKEGKLSFSLCPALPKEMFLKKDRKESYYLPDGTLVEETMRKGTLKFMLLGSIPVTYHNPKMKDIFGAVEGKAQVRYEVTPVEGKAGTFAGKVPEPYSAMIRDRRVKEIKVFFN